MLLDICKRKRDLTMKLTTVIEKAICTSKINGVGKNVGYAVGKKLAQKREDELTDEETQVQKKA
jgi:hypothetical protein